MTVMAGLDPAIRIQCVGENKTWMPGTRPGMTNEGLVTGLKCGSPG
jgi:hypothetical protein